jgi:hypothetical protein
VFWFNEFELYSSFDRLRNSENPNEMANNPKTPEASQKFDLPPIALPLVISDFPPAEAWT